MSKDGYQGCVIYGRRRMGKTELVRKCVLEQKLDKPCQLKVSGSAIYVSGLFEHAQTDDWEAVDCFMDCLSYTMCSYLSE